MTEKEHKEQQGKEKRIREAFKAKDWNQIKTADSWQIFKVMGEFVNGFEKLAKIGPCVSIFGSARTQPNDPYYELAEEIAFLLTKKGIFRWPSLRIAIQKRSIFFST